MDVWFDKVAWPAAANALGTLAAAFVLLVLGVLAGVIDDIPTRARGDLTRATSSA